MKLLLFWAIKMTSTDIMRVQCNMLFSIYFRHVMLPKDIAKRVPKTHLMSETEWRNLGVQQSQGWVHYMIHQPGVCVCSSRCQEHAPILLFHWVFMFLTSFLYRTTYLTLQTPLAHCPIPLTPKPLGFYSMDTVWRCLGASQIRRCWYHLCCFWFLHSL